jgi:UDP-N-acetylmuramoyl-tripeptide--D-alanyl-D-alanine ligase
MVRREYPNIFYLLLIKSYYSPFTSHNSRFQHYICTNLLSMISIEALYNIYKQHPSVTTDTRSIKQGDIFFALKGPSFNGNVFAQKALDAGAAFAVIDEDAFAKDERLLLTGDVLTTLQNLSKYHRQQLNIPFIAITGSNGKTTTKELVHAVLSTTYKTYTTTGNLNNHIGVPLTILKIQPDAEMAVIEMGANHLKEIESYCSYTLPTHGLITNCGKAHLEGFGGVEGVRKGKGELFDFLRANDGVAFVCDDFEYFHTMVKGLKEIHWYGTQNGELTGTALQSDPFLEVAISKGLEPMDIATALVGSYNIYNVLVAAIVGKYFNVPAKKIKEALEAYTPGNSRSQLIEKGGNHIILDAYNANPSSMNVAIENFAKLQAENKILFLGAMMELGETSQKEHESLIAQIAKYAWKDVVLVGGDFKNTPHPHRYFDNSVQAAEWWAAQQSTGNYLLVKGSRSMMMEKIIA